MIYQPGRTGWNGRYFVTLILPDGTVHRQDAAKQLPDKCTIAAMNNGKHGREWVAKLIHRVKESVT